MTKRFGSKRALGDVSFEIPEGSVVGLIGPNGSGKTTALRLILGLIRESEGQVSVFGTRPCAATADCIGYLPEERGLYRRMSVRDVLTYYARLKGCEPEPAHLEAWLERLAIPQFIDTEVRHLSKGTAQKVQLIASLLHRPRLLILDEPFSGLDPVSHDLVQRAIGEYQAGGHTIILSTHDMLSAERLCHSVVMLHHGYKVLDGPVAGVEHGSRLSIRVSVRGAPPPAALLPGVEGVVARGAEYELVLESSANPQLVLSALVAHCEVVRYELSRPSLHDIFLRLAARRAESIRPQVGHA